MAEAKVTKEPTPRDKFEKMVELTRRLVAVPKSEITKRPKAKRKRR